jgi:hypothetical protein
LLICKHEACFFHILDYQFYKCIYSLYTCLCLPTPIDIFGPSFELASSIQQPEKLQKKTIAAVAVGWQLVVGIWDLRIVQTDDTIMMVVQTVFVFWICIFKHYSNAILNV